MTDLKWFKKEFEQYLQGYEIKYKFYENGDFGDLNQIEFNSQKRGGEIDFWSSGWLNVHFVDYLKGDVLINILLEPSQQEKKEEIFKKLQEFL